MKKYLFMLGLSLVGIVSAAACTSTETNTTRHVATPDGTGTSESLQAAADAAFSQTEEANSLLETALSATETQSASLVTVTPMPSRTPTLTPTPSTTPSSTPATYPFPFNKSMPIEWEGSLDGPSILQIEEIVANGFFSGNFTT